MPLNLCAPPKNHRERTMASKFFAEKGTIESQAIRMGACRDATAPGFPTEAATLAQETSQFPADDGPIGSEAISM